jgi:long-chain acyl-CoA synthetase
VVVLDTLVPVVEAACEGLGARAPRLIVVGSGRMQTRDDRRVIPETAPGTAADTFDELAATPADPARLPGAAAADADADALALLVYTSGTTGVPKAAMLSHGNLAFNARTIMHWYDLDQRPGRSWASRPFSMLRGWWRISRSALPPRCRWCWPGGLNRARCLMRLRSIARCSPWAR